MATQVIKTKLFDAFTHEERAVEVRIDEQGIYIRPEGYGDMCSNDGHGTPALFEFAEGKPRFAIWGNINEEDPTQIVEFEGAKESLREDD